MYHDVNNNNNNAFPLSSAAGPSEFWVQLLPSNQLSVYYQDSLKRLVALPASTAEAYSLQDYTLPAFCGDPTVKEVQQRLEEEWAAGAAAREAEAASRPRWALGDMRGAQCCCVRVLGSGRGSHASMKHRRLH
jgi:hypothetical protein